MSSITGFWHNEDDAGFGVGLNDLDGMDFDLYRERILEMAREMEASLSDVLKDLEAYAQSKHDPSIKETMALMSKITWLEWNGHLQSDNFNGMLYMVSPLL